MDKITQLAKQITLMIFDVDGVLTDGKLYFDRNGEAMKAFHILDGLGMKLLRNANIQTAIITGRDSPMVEHRAKELGIQHIYQGHSNKQAAYHELKTQLRLTDHQIAYMGDDLNDLPLLRQAGLAITVPNAVEIVKEHSDWVTTRQGGHGAAREAIEMILHAKGILEQVYGLFLL